MPFCCFSSAFLSHVHTKHPVFCCSFAAGLHLARCRGFCPTLSLPFLLCSSQIIFLLSGDHIFRIRFVHGNNFSWPLSGNSVINDLTVRIVKFVVPSHSEGWIFIQSLNFIKSYFTRLNPSTHVKKSCTAQKLKIS